MDDPQDNQKPPVIEAFNFDLRDDQFSEHQKQMIASLFNILEQIKHDEISALTIAGIRRDSGFIRNILVDSGTVSPYAIMGILTLSRDMFSATIQEVLGHSRNCPHCETEGEEKLEPIM